MIVEIGIGSILDQVGLESKVESILEYQAQTI